MTTRISVTYLSTGQPQAEGVRIDCVMASGDRKQLATLQAGEAVEMDVSAGSHLVIGEMLGAFPTNGPAVASNSDLPAQAPTGKPGKPTPPYAAVDPPVPAPPSDAPAAEDPTEKPEGKRAVTVALSENDPQPVEQH